MKSLIELSRDVLYGRKVIQESGQDLKKLSVKAINDAFMYDPRPGYKGHRGMIKSAVFHGMDEGKDGSVQYVYTCRFFDDESVDVVIWEDEKGNIAGQTV